MYLSRLVLNPTSRAVRRDLADCQELHRTVMSGFPDHDANARQHFGVLHRVDQRRDTGMIALLVQSAPEPSWSGLTDGYALQVSVKDISHAYGSIDVGHRLRFRLLANVTKKIKSAGPNGRRVALRSDAERAVWLQRHLETGGAELAALVSAEDLPDLLARSALPGRVRGRHRVGRLSFAAVLFDGHLQVTDAERFRETLRSGVGSAKAYGFGLLSVARG